MPRTTTQNPPLQKVALTIPSMSSFDEVRRVLAQLVENFQTQLLAQFPVTNYEGHRISNVGVPVEADDVVTLKYLVGTQPTPQIDEKITNSPAGQGGLFWRTLDIKSTQVGNNIADVTTAHKGGTVLLVAGVLRKAITADLTVRLNIGSSIVGSFTIPHTTGVKSPISFTTFTTSLIPDLGVFVWDITASDGSLDGDGVASFTVWWA